MTVISFLVDIPSEICGNNKATLEFDEGSWPDNAEAKLKVTNPLTCASPSQITVTNDSKRIHREWNVVIRRTKHNNHTYLVTIVKYQKKYK
jgi:hypothetical protein